VCSRGYKAVEMLAVAAAVEPTEKRRHRIKHWDTFLSRKLSQMENDWRWKRAGDDKSVKDTKKVIDTIKSDLTNFRAHLDCALHQHYQKNGTSVYACDVSAEAQMVAFGGTSYEVTVCGLSDGMEKWKGTHTMEVHGCQFSGDGKLLATCGGEVKIWNTANGEMKYSFQHDPADVTVAWSHDGTMLATGGDAKMIGVWWSYEEPKALIFEQKELPQGVTVVRFSGDGKWFGIAGGEKNLSGYVYVYKLNKR
jgi:WD40 repeat protein